uniref:Major facilitator superfamily (MFS) profile domain-containing protein n=1 Tax=Cynoglossus semilaevis TaxID=244447 RepID=A0A3P8W0D4_CYNSE
MKHYAETVAFLGQWGRFQQVVFFLLCASIVANGFGAFTLVFLTDTPRHHCRVPDVNLTEDWRNFTIPFEVVDGKQELSRCSRYRLDVIRNLSAQGYVPSRDVSLTDLEQEGCVDGWVYSTDIYQSTVVSEFDLVCGDEWKQPFTSTVYFVGSLMGSFLSGKLSDRFGRKPVLFVTMALQAVCTFLQSYSNSWLLFTILLFISGLGQVSNYVAGLVLGAEILTGHVRVLYSSLGTCFGFAVGYMMLPVFAYFIRDWRNLLLALAVVGAVYLPFWWLIPESPRWLLSHGRVEEAEAIVRKAAKWNKCQAPMEIFADYCTPLKEKYGVFDLLRTSNIRITTLILSFVALVFTITTGYFALCYNTPQLHANPYLSCFISAVTELPAYISCWLALRFWPRRLSLIAALLVGAVSLYSIQLVPNGKTESDFKILTCNTRKPNSKRFNTTFNCSTTIYILYLIKLYPTPLRNTATGATGTISRLGSCPFVFLGIYFKFLPYIILGTVSLLAALSTFFMPESFQKPLPETIEQMQNSKRYYFGTFHVVSSLSKVLSF